LHRRNQMWARPPINFWGLKTTHCELGGDAWRMNQKNYFMLVCWLWHCAATAVALQMHEGMNEFNLVCYIFGYSPNYMYVNVILKETR